MIEMMKEGGDDQSNERSKDRRVEGSKFEAEEARTCRADGCRAGHADERLVEKTVRVSLILRQPQLLGAAKRPLRHGLHHIRAAELECAPMRRKG